MQYRPVGDSPAIFNIGSGDMSTLSSLAEEIDQLSNDGSVDFNGKHAVVKSVIDVEQSSAARSASLDSKEYLGWSSKTSLQDGAASTLAWHLDRALPFFPPSASDGEPRPLDGEDILSRRGLASCSHRDDPTCLREAHTSYPCASECSTKTCVPSVFDGVLELSREVTEDCETVLYTVSLGYDVKKLHLQTQYSDGQEQKKNNDPTLCTIAFVPTESRLVESVIAKVPASAIEKMNLDLSENSDYETKLKKLSGHLVHQGWILIFVDGATQPLTAEDIFMPKLSPRRLFHPSVRRAMFVDENFSSTPLPEDALFLASEMLRGKLKKRTVMGPNERGKKVKYKLPEEPPRTAVLMVAPTRNLPKADSHHMPLKEITLHLIREVGGSEDDPEPKEVRVQREFYEKARSLINSFELRSLDNVSRHRIEIKDFIRSRWVLHDLKEEEGHQLRCEWYREHVRWNTHLDQLSFAYVMARRELTRKVITEQPLQTEVEKVSLLQIVIDATSDAKEWHPIFSGEGNTLPIHHSQIAPEVIPQNLQDQHEVTEVSPDSAALDDGTNTFYVRIMSDERMMEARKAWIKARKDKLKGPKM
ncbi:hypothetical protein HJC23_006497 [Cyclotella cryptica]|uniref:Uncharacterized protein n=1 Tax=Cyclotella cryptica TaxID=29204 RepID=A0ABD3PMV5_9STRA